MQYTDKKVLEASDTKKQLHPYVKSGNVLMKASHAGNEFPPHVNELEGWRRQPSKSALPTGTLTQGVNVDFEINSTGDIITAIDEVTQATNEGTRETTNYSN